MTAPKSNRAQRAPKVEIELRGLVLRTYPYGDSNLVVRILTDQKGKLSLVAKSARHSKKRFAGGFDIFDCGTVRIRTGKTSNDIFGEISEFLPIKSFAPLRESITRIIVATFLSECFEYIVAEGDEESLHAYETLFLALEAISHSTEVKEALKAAFLALGSLLEQEGILPTDSLVPTAKNLLYLCQVIENHSNRKIISKDEVFNLLKSSATTKK